ncbi:hypothetical protein EVAR_23769_1 [Eumeta japonica]|uniref:Uncharacterized protein n=1 Tax=Eumeta variegata TaxID=151549 RepID=A0A4C1VGL7_EUMVA|nr:hypothetical protein EVAR_23769_1 [Eumeta japonica]
MFYWPYGKVSRRFLNTMREAMRVTVVTNPRLSVFSSLIKAEVNRNNTAEPRPRRLTTFARLGVGGLDFITAKANGESCYSESLFAPPDDGFRI